MNFYDKIHDMVRCFKETNEYKEYMNLKTMIKKDNEKYARLKMFKDKQKEHQIAYINAQEINKDEQAEMQNLYSLIIQDESCRKMLETEMKLDVMLADIQKIMSEAVKEIIEF